MAPFQYFTSHRDPDLIDAVRKGREREMARFGWSIEPSDPQAEETFHQCKLNHDRRSAGQPRVLRTFYRAVLGLRRSDPALAYPDRARMEVSSLAPARAMAVRCWSARREIVTIFHFGTQRVTVLADLARGSWDKILDSAEARWSGPGSDLPLRLDSRGRSDFALSPSSVFSYARDFE